MLSRTALPATTPRQRAAPQRSPCQSSPCLSLPGSHNTHQASATCIPPTAYHPNRCKSPCRPPATHQWSALCITASARRIASKSHEPPLDPCTASASPTNERLFTARLQSPHNAAHATAPGHIPAPEHAHLLTAKVMRKFGRAAPDAHSAHLQLAESHQTSVRKAGFTPKDVLSLPPARLLRESRSWLHFRPLATRAPIPNIHWPRRLTSRPGVGGGRSSQVGRGILRAGNLARGRVRGRASANSEVSIPGRPGILTGLTALFAQRRRGGGSGAREKACAPSERACFRGAAWEPSRDEGRQIVGIQLQQPKIGNRHGPLKQIEYLA